MKKIITLFCLHILMPLCAQEYSSANIHSHNDYSNKLPFVEAFNNEVGVIEADVFLLNNDLFLAHTANEILPNYTLKKIYLDPLLDKIKALKGYPYKNDKTLDIMIDVKSEAVSTLDVIVKQLNAYPEIVSCNAIRIVISGNRPDRTLWQKYPSFICFDGRISEIYTSQQLARVAMISEDIKNQTVWNGKGVLVQADLDKIQTLIREVHNKNKKIRFWSTQDNVNTWITLMGLKVDYIGTDKTSELSQFLSNNKKFSYNNTAFYKAYIPKNISEPFVKKHPKNIILLIGDGMGLTQIYAGYTANKGQLNMFNIPTQGFSITEASDSYITDSAAGATAMATGHKSKNRFLGVDPSGSPLESITQKLAKKKYQTAIISSGNITDATPAGFYAHQIDRSFNEAIANDFLSNPSDILIGGGVEEFTKRKDDINLGEILRKKGYTFSIQWKAIDTIQNKRFVLLDNEAVVSKKAGRGDFLEKAFEKTCNSFSKTSKPFFIMEEGAQIDYGGHQNDLEYVIREVLDFDQLVGKAMAFVDENQETLLIVTADHETGGLTLIDGNSQTGYVLGDFSTNDHTAVTVPVFAYGPGAENFKGVYQNTAIYSKIVEVLSLK
ncbi:alkaline phosphatase [Flavobacterium sp. ZT3R18]|uniref:alkaline phosphatase n=1 Tax=Flavobacterium sp. ZT3R18 TaxID=2594429 RepID=UPI00117B7F2C|nr:alkaline phosphatase [Flavobacterium sp. ZT3R18]TRX38859.1 alkaline phosphatase [Flavobacterium sp. ZT3R18]